MYLKNLQIKNFRCIEGLTLEFDKGLNVIIGENNTGKTAVIDALRLSFSIGLQRREIFLSPDDFFIDRSGKKTNEIEFHLAFSDISEEEQGIFIEMLAINDGSEPELKLHVRYELINKNGIEKIKFRYWGGDNEGQNIPPELMGLFYFVYLGALRNAERDLRPGRGNRLGQLFMKLERDRDEQEKYANSLNEKINEDLRWIKLIDKAKKKVNAHLEKTSILNNTQTIEIDFLPLEFRKIVENMKIFLPFKHIVKREEITSTLGTENEVLRKYFTNPDEENLEFKDGFKDILKSDTEINGNIKKKMEDIYNKALIRFEIGQNGLGYNNLIYIATVLGDLLERKSIDKETYITLLLEEPEAHLHPQLQDILFNYFKEIENQNIQIFITSHSPTITAKTDIDSTIVLYKKNDKILSLPLRKCPLDSNHKKYLERFLDVTKFQLFFAKGVILVEGISEALLLPVFADIMGEKYNLDKNGIEVINIGGVAFEPFAKLFNSEDPNERLSINCAIITDNDRNGGSISNRAENVKNMERGLLKVSLAEYTFEYELYTSGNGDILNETYKSLHPNFSIIEDKSIEEQAKSFVKQLKKSNNKAPFAQKLSQRLTANKTLRSNFQVPNYIKDAIKWVVKNDE